MSIPVDAIIRYENGDATALETLELFAGLVGSGAAWTLQGSYGRTANSFLEQGLIDPSGHVTAEARDFYSEPDPNEVARIDEEMYGPNPR